MHENLLFSLQKHIAGNTIAYFALLVCFFLCVYMCVPSITVYYRKNHPTSTLHICLFVLYVPEAKDVCEELPAPSHHGLGWAEGQVDRLAWPAADATNLHTKTEMETDEYPA